MILINRNVFATFDALSSRLARTAELLVHTMQIQNPNTFNLFRAGYVPLSQPGALTLSTHRDAHVNLKARPFEGRRRVSSRPSYRKRLNCGLTDVDRLLLQLTRDKLDIAQRLLAAIATCTARASWKSTTRQTGRGTLCVYVVTPKRTQRLRAEALLSGGASDTVGASQIRVRVRPSDGA